MHVNLFKNIQYQGLCKQGVEQIQGIYTCFCQFYIEIVGLARFNNRRLQYFNKRVFGVLILIHIYFF